MAKPLAKVTQLHSRAPRGAPLLPENIDHFAAQAELDAQLFPHYLLGRQLALEEVVREMVMTLPDAQRADFAKRLREASDIAMDRLQEGIDDNKDEAATCGYVCTLIQQGF